MVITNSLSFDRHDEVVQLSLNQFELDAMGSTSEIGLGDEQGEWQLIQWLDENEDGKSDALLFQPNVASNGVSTYWLKNLNGDQNPTSDNTCYSRLVPERTDDYTWENDRVAFRMYGPAA